MKVTYIDHMGTDLSVVNAARVSFGKKSDWKYAPVFDEFGNEVDERAFLSTNDLSLIHFLARGCTRGDWEKTLDEVVRHSYNIAKATDPHVLKLDDECLKELLNHIRRMPPHWTPFAHTAISLHIKAPLFVTRQINKHQVGFVINEVSRRYVTDTPEFYTPSWWRKKAENVKQGSSSDVVEVPDIRQVWDTVQEWYENLLDRGICPEQARMVLPQSMYTEFYMTGNLYGWANLYNQRTDSHAQKEVQEVAHQIGAIIEPLFPESWRALTQ
jgi:thymidylate synthase (FAD)